MNHWEQLKQNEVQIKVVVICFQISIFEPLGTIDSFNSNSRLSCDLLSN
ncbi:hypothetical protein M089_2178 [Bacteroides ovatus str. 3725 D9 iii]|nr:hypothetical protein M089_2178 [Bacteroides ovatus str. 3725 D9 iii]